MGRWHLNPETGHFHGAQSVPLSGSHYGGGCIPGIRADSELISPPNTQWPLFSASCCRWSDLALVWEKRFLWTCEKLHQMQGSLECVALVSRSGKAAASTCWKRDGFRGFVSLKEAVGRRGWHGQGQPSWVLQSSEIFIISERKGPVEAPEPSLRLRRHLD